MRTLRLPLLLSLAACTAAEPLMVIDVTDPEAGLVEAPADVVDLRRTFDPSPWDEASTYAFTTEPLMVPPFEERQLCIYTSWPEETSGITGQVAFQSQFGHHFIAASSKATQREIPDGTVVDCTETNSIGMESFEPFLTGGVVASAETKGEFELPEGYATRVKADQRIVFQSHYVNTSPDPVVVQDHLQMHVVPEDDVETWAASFAFTEVDLDIPPGGEHTISFTCTWEDDYEVLFVGGHMHEWGKRYSVDATVTDTDQVDSPRIYEIPEWDPYMRDAPIYADFVKDLGQPLSVTAGDTFTTTCTWDNTEDEALGFPAEMCATFGMVYPAKAAVICEADE